MIASAPAILFDSVPWWIGVTVLYLTILVAGMALDETYVNRMTPLAAALVLSVHSLLNDGLWLPLSLYVDVGLGVGLYGLYAYVVDGYVGEAFRLVAYLLYSPLSIVLVLLFPEILFVVALAVAGYANMHLLAFLHPVEPYYFGPDSASDGPTDEDEWGTRRPIERSDGEPGVGLSSTIADRSVATILAGDSDPSDERSDLSQRPARDPADSPAEVGTVGSPDADAPNASATEAPPAEESTPDRGVLPGFMRRV